MKLEIDILSNPKKFVDEWSSCYNYGNPRLYFDNIKNGLYNYENFLNLFRWKNGIYNIFEKKIRVINQFWEDIETLKDHKKEFDWKKFETTFKPHVSSPIWKIFLLHISDPGRFPIFDVHVYRFHFFISEHKIEEIPVSSIKKYNYYKNQYFPWFNEFKKKYSLDPQKMDESFFRFGQMIKSLNGLPISIKT